MTQNDEILKHLQLGNTLTPLEALNLYGCMRLGARIWEIKRMGYPIHSEKVHVHGPWGIRTVPTRDGGTAIVCRYSIPRE